MSTWVLGVIRSYTLGSLHPHLAGRGACRLIHPRYSGPQCGCITTVLTLPAGLPSQPGEFRPELLTEPCVNLSTYTARATA